MSENESLPASRGEDGVRRRWIPPRLEKNADQLDDVRDKKAGIPEVPPHQATTPSGS